MAKFGTIEGGDTTSFGVEKVPLDGDCIRVRKIGVKIVFPNSPWLNYGKNKKDAPKWLLKSPKFWENTDKMSVWVQVSIDRWVQCMDEDTEELLCPMETQEGGEIRINPYLKGEDFVIDISFLDCKSIGSCNLKNSEGQEKCECHFRISGFPNHNRPVDRGVKDLWEQVKYLGLKGEPNHLSKVGKPMFGWGSAGRVLGKMLIRDVLINALGRGCDRRGKPQPGPDCCGFTALPGRGD